MARTITKAAARLDIGLQRSQNEDSLGCRQARNDEEGTCFGDLFVLADGMGGHAAGEVASRLAVETILSAYYASPPDSVAKGLVDAINRANQLIFQKADEDRKLHGMGTTCVCSAVHRDSVYVAHVGDSRAYLFRNDALEQVTQDHSWVEEQVRYGLLTSEEARSHPMRNVITRALGNAPDVEVDLSVLKIQPRDVILICSDGLTSAVDDVQIRATLASQKEPQAAVDALVRMANDAGGPDNISVIAIRIEDVFPLPDGEESAEPSRKKGWTRFLPFS